MNTSHSFHVPGKLMLSGEWNILTTGRSCITLPTKGIQITIEPAEFSCITSPTFGLTRHSITLLNQEHNTSAIFLTRMITAATALINAYGIKHKSFHITIENNPQTYVMHNGSLHKLGVGSSACTAAGIIKAIALFHEIMPCDKELFEQAFLAHYKAQHNVGSGFDIAAAVAGRAIMYTSNGPALTIKPVTIPPSWHWAIGFSGTSAHTPSLIRLFQTAVCEKKQTFEAALCHIEKIVQSLATAIEQNDIKTALNCIHENQQQLDMLSKSCNNALTTPPLRHMIDLATKHGAAAKFSGAGGGDCVIALCSTQDVKNNVCKAWAAAGFIPVEGLLN